MTPDTHHPPQWRQRLLALLAAFKLTADGLSATFARENLRFLDGWAGIEGGGAVENPINTTYGLAGSTLLEGNTAGVRHYRAIDDPRPVEGIAATGITIAAKVKLADGSRVLRYARLLGAMQAGTLTAEDIVEHARDDLVTWAGGRTDYPDVLKAALPPAPAASREARGDSPDYAKIEKSADGQWYFTIHAAGNGAVIATSETFRRRRDAVATLSTHFGWLEF